MVKNLLKGPNTNTILCLLIFSLIANVILVYFIFMQLQSLDMLYECLTGLEVEYIFFDESPSEVATPDKPEHNAEPFMENGPKKK